MRQKRQRLAVAPRWRAVAVTRYSLETVKEGEVPLFIRQGRNEVAERRGNGQTDTPPVTIADTEQYGVANQRAMVRAAAAQAQNRFGEDEADIVLQALAQTIGPVGGAVHVARPRAYPDRPVGPKLYGSGGDVVRPEVKGPTADEVKARVVPVAGQNAVFDRAAV